MSYSNFTEWHKLDSDNRMYCNIEGGKKITMPRYYKEKIYNEAERKRVGAITARKMLQIDKELEEMFGAENHFYIQEFKKLDQAEASIKRTQKNGTHGTVF